MKREKLVRICDSVDRVNDSDSLDLRDYEELDNILESYGIKSSVYDIISDHVDRYEIIKANRDCNIYFVEGDPEQIYSDETLEDEAQMEEIDVEEFAKSFTKIPMKKGQYMLITEFGEEGPVSAEDMIKIIIRDYGTSSMKKKLKAGPKGSVKRAEPLEIGGQVVDKNDYITKDFLRGRENPKSGWTKYYDDSFIESLNLSDNELKFYMRSVNTFSYGDSTSNIQINDTDFSIVDTKSSSYDYAVKVYLVKDGDENKIEEFMNWSGKRYILTTQKVHKTKGVYTNAELVNSSDDFTDLVKLIE